MCESCGCGDVPDSKQRSKVGKITSVFRGIPVVAKALAASKRIWQISAPVSSTRQDKTC